MPVSCTAMESVPSARSSSRTDTDPWSRLYFTALRDQVVEDDLDLAAVGRQAQGGRGQERHVDAAPIRQRLHRLDGRARHLDQVDVGQVAPLLPRLDARQVEQVEDQLAHAVEAHAASAGSALS